MRLLVASLVGSMIWFTVLLGPLSGDAPTILRAFGGSHARAAQRAVDLVPSGAAVSATNGLGSHLSARREIYLFPVVRDARWVVRRRARSVRM
jgi:hypothetical protein